MATRYIIVLLVVHSSYLIHCVPTTSREVTWNDTNYRTVNISTGVLLGQRIMATESSGIDVFLGIPYAKPPIGQRRLARPEPAEAWTGTRDALAHGNNCIQRVIPKDPKLDNVSFSEDCLYLSVYAPWPSTVGKPVPTMMFIHGGGYYGGSGALYNFTNLAMDGVVVVSINYRLDVMGFLSTEDGVIPGNFGLLDQIMALDWIRDNISPFGGNPHDITVFGGSSGASSTSILSMSPLARGKFQKAIMQSGVASCGWSVALSEDPIMSPAVLAGQLGQMVNCTSPVDMIACFRGLDAEVLMNASVRLQMGPYKSAMLWKPVVETSFGVLPSSPHTLLENTGDIHHIPTMYGYNTDDGASVVRDADGNGITMDEFKATLNFAVQSLYEPNQRVQVYSDVMKAYLPDGENTGLSPIQLRDVLVDAATDALYKSCVISESRKFGVSGNQGQTESYIFEFAYRPSYSSTPAWQGVVHADEKGFVMGLPQGPDPFKYPSRDADDQKVADYVTKMWSNFAKTGNPTPKSVDGVMWPQFGNQHKVMVIKENLSVIDIARKSQLNAWTRVHGSIFDIDDISGGTSVFQLKLNAWPLIVFMCVLSHIVY